MLTGDPAGLVACDAAAGELMAGSAEVPELRWGYGPLAALAFAGLFTERFAEADRALVMHFQHHIDPAATPQAPSSEAGARLACLTLSGR